jgi:hypothetical protein
VPVSLASVSALLATDWVEWTAIATFIAAGAAIALGIVTLLLVLVTREMVTNASDEIAIERRRIDEAIRPRVFPAGAMIPVIRKTLAAAAGARSYRLRMAALASR